MALAAKGTRVFGTAKKIHASSGRLLGYVISHSQASAQTVTFYDNIEAKGAIIHRVIVAPEQSPATIRFGKDDGIMYLDGLTVDPGNCDVAVWAMEFNN